MKNSGQIFKGEFYTVTYWQTDGPEEFSATISFNTDHKIFKAHFPGNPITPGACVVQIATELLSDHLKKEMILSEAKTIKFVNLINPLENNKVDFVFKITPDEDNCIRASIKVCSEPDVFVKISALFRENSNAAR